MCECLTASQPHTHSLTQRPVWCLDCVHWCKAWSPSALYVRISCGSVHSVILLRGQALPASLPWLSHSKKANTPEREKKKKAADLLFSHWSGRRGVNCICWIRLLIRKSAINELIWHAACLARSPTLWRAPENSFAPYCNTQVMLVSENYEPEIKDAGNPVWIVRVRWFIQA